MSRIPASTYRMQFHKDFPFSEAAKLAGYLKRLGIGDLYASPILTAESGSQHGYDVTDPTRLNRELGGGDGFRELSQSLREHEIGLLLDIVPNHMAASLENPWWRDVLQHGMHSAYAKFFDIDWHASTPGVTGKVLLPVLGQPFGQALEGGELTLDHDGDDYGIRYFDRLLPVSPESRELILHLDDPSHAIRAMNGTPGDPESFDALEALIGAQHYRLAYWQVARDAINYRRFFDVSDLVSLRAEDEAVFEATHRLLLDLAETGDLTGFRIDHIDGLRDPAGYLERLQRALPARDAAQSGTTHFYVVVEKILASDEALPDDWQTDGTSGYDFLNVLNGVFVERRSEPELDRIYSRLRGAEADFEELVYQRKHQVMDELFAGDIHQLAHQLWEIAARSRAGHDLLLPRLEAALIEVIAHLSVYRTYTRSLAVAPADRRRIEVAIDRALVQTPELGPELGFIRSVLELEFLENLDDADKERWFAFVARWQQFTGPIMAKGFEDTSLYVFNRLISLNEVGGEPDPMGVPLADLHAWATVRQDRWHGAINATSTHDTKRSEDVRARINVLSEMPAEWDAALSRWQDLNRDKKDEVDGVSAPDGNEDHLIYETMIGAWPFDTAEVPEFRERMKEYVLKASREAKTHTSWIDQNAEYEDALTGFLDRIISDNGDDPFITDFVEFQQTAAYHGALNSLSQTLLKICLPGVPDFYQGTELWDLSLVDPDNRRPVDYELRSALLADLLSRKEEPRAGELMNDWQSGRIKLHLISRALDARNAHPDLFSRGAYVPLTATTVAERHVVSFARRRADDWALVIAPRLTVGLARLRGRPLAQPPLGDAFWADMILPIPVDAPGRWRNVLTGSSVESGKDNDREVLSLADVLGELPMALLVPETP